MAEMAGESTPYQAFGSVVIAYAKCSTRKEVKHHEHTKCKWFTNRHEPAFCRRHSPLGRQRLRNGVVPVVFVDQFDGLESAVVGTRGGVVGPWNWQHLVDHCYLGYVAHDGFFELVQHPSLFHLLHERLGVTEIDFRSVAGLSRGAVSGTRIASANGQ